MPPKKDSTAAPKGPPSKAEPKKATAASNSKSGTKKSGDSPKKLEVVQPKAVTKSLEQILQEARIAWEEKNKLEAEQKALEESSKPPPVLQPSEIIENFIRTWVQVLIDDPRKLEPFFDDEASICVDGHICKSGNAPISIALCVRPIL